jgi:F-type H+-transporting ATPase subunit delta
VRRGAAVARRYAKALWELANQESRLEAVGQELLRFERVLAEEPELRSALLLPWSTAATKRDIVVAVSERLGLSTLARNFLALVAQRRRMALLADIREAYQALADQAAGRVRARVRSAAPLDDAQRSALRERLGRQLGKTVLLDTAVDPSLLGGFVAEVGSRLLDMSLRGQLARLRERLAGDSGGIA